MNIRIWTTALTDVDLGWEPGALAPDLKILPLKIQINKTRNQEKLDATAVVDR